MKIATTAAPLLFAVTILTAGGFAVAQANAADVRLSDVGYINAARCAGLAQGAGLNTTAFDQLVDAQSGGRERLANVIANGAREDAARQAGSGDYWRARALATINSSCRDQAAVATAPSRQRVADAATGR